MTAETLREDFLQRNFFISLGFHAVVLMKTSPIMYELLL